MSITEFVAANASAKPKAEIVQRWESRVVAEGMNLRGRAGAEAYIGQYLQGAKAPKAIGFARIAEIKGFPEMAVRFWEEAFYLEYGKRATLVAAAGGASAPAEVIAAPKLQESFGQNPQLLVLLSESEAASKVLDPAYGLQEKIDGHRALIRVKSGVVSRGNKKGLLAPVPLAVADALASIGDALIDGEEVKGVFHAFDLLSFDGKDLRDESFLDRHTLLTAIFANRPALAALKIVPLITETSAKLAFVAELEARGAEGYVMKRLSAGYEAGDSHGTQWKYQFRATSSFIVGVRNGAKESVQILVNKPDGTLRDMGNLTVRTGIPAQGSIVEVQYLYCHVGPSGKLHQPIFKGVRTDADAADCQIGKIKVKGTADLGDDDE